MLWKIEPKFSRHSKNHRIERYENGRDQSGRRTVHLFSSEKYAYQKNRKIEEVGKAYTEKLMGRLKAEDGGDRVDKRWPASLSRLQRTMDGLEILRKGPVFKHYLAEISLQ